MKAVLAVVLTVLAHPHVTAGHVSVPVASPATALAVLVLTCAALAVVLARAIPRSCPHMHPR